MKQVYFIERENLNNRLDFDYVKLVTENEVEFVSFDDIELRQEYLSKEALKEDLATIIGNDLIDLSKYLIKVRGYIATEEVDG